MDTDEFTAQLTRYSILEQGIETNSQLSITNDYLQSSATAASFSYIGKDVEIETNIAAVQDNQITWLYDIEGLPSDVTLTITDEDGTQLATADGVLSSEVQTITFDASGYGLDDGQQLFLSINALDSDGESLDKKITSIMTVDGVWSDGDLSYLTAGQLSFRDSDILKLVDKVPNITVNDEPENNETTNDETT